MTGSVTLRQIISPSTLVLSWCLVLDGRPLGSGQSAPVVCQRRATHSPPGIHPCGRALHWCAQTYWLLELSGRRRFRVGEQQWQEMGGKRTQGTLTCSGVCCVVRFTESMLIKKRQKNNQDVFAVSVNRSNSADWRKNGPLRTCRTPV